MARSRVSRFSPVPLTCLLLVALPASSQLPPASFHEEITVTATGVEERAEEVPVPVTVITRQEMDDAQADTVAAMLRRSPGVIVSSSGDEGKVTSLFTRGTESDHTLVLLDGVRLSSPYFGGYDWSLLPTAGLDRVEVARGPFSALWGSDAVGGVVNLIPARARRGIAGGLVAEGGEAGWQRLEGGFGFARGAFDLYASASTRQGRGELDNSDFDLRQGLVDLGWSMGEGRRLGLLVQDAEGETGIPFSTPGVPTPDRRQWSDQRLVAAPLQLKVAEGWRLELTPSWVERVFRFHDPGDPWGLTGSRTSADTLEGRLASHHDLGRHTLTWGGEWRQDEVDDVTVLGVNLADRVDRTSSAFIQDQWQPGEAVRLVAGARWDSTREWGSEVSPRLNLGWAVSRALELRASYGQAFRQPSVGELYFPLFGNPALEPETSRSSELGLAFWAPDEAWRGQLNLFSTGLSNLIEYDYARMTFANVRAARIAGAEAQVDVPLGALLAGSASLTWLHTEGADGQPLLRRPALSGSLTVHGEPRRGLSGDLTLVWVGARDDIDPLSFARTTNRGVLTASLALALELWHGVEATVRATNLTGAAYQEVLGYPAPGRRLYAGIRLGG